MIGGVANWFGSLCEKSRQCFPCCKNKETETEDGRESLRLTSQETSDSGSCTIRVARALGGTAVRNFAGEGVGYRTPRVLETQEEIERSPSPKNPFQKV